MKVLVLVIFSSSRMYNVMYNLQKKYILQHKNIDVYFVTFNKKQPKKVILINNVIFIEGDETLPNITYKTIMGLDYIHNNISSSYDFVVRTNVSTLINLNNLFNFLSSIENKNIYTGGTLETLKWKLSLNEITKNKEKNRNDYYGLKYIQGTSIIMSYDVVEEFLKIKDNIEYDIVDDVKIGILIRTYLPEVYDNIEKNPFAKVSFNNYEHDSVFIRNKSNKRKTDLFRMRDIVNKYFMNK